MRTFAALLLAALPAFGQLPDAFSHRIDANLVYNVASGQELKLDVIRPRNAAGPLPVVMRIHGGGWVAGSKEASALWGMPFLEMGLAVVNVEYRLAKVAQAPAAIEDCRCALRWIVRNAERFKFDVGRIVVSGDSSGGHLALMTGMATSGAGFDRGCPAEEKTRWTGSDKSEPKVAAIINWYGITDLRDMIEGAANARGYAIEWIGNRDDAAQLAAKASPLTYVRAGLPPILTIHGDRDMLVPIAHARRLHEALQKAGATNELLVISGAGHGDFNPQQARQIDDAIRAFLRKHHVLR
jgi:acetyl esterase/lipase